MVNLAFGLAQLVLVLGSPVGPATDREAMLPVEHVRMVCDQDCNCWRTRYRERRPMLAGRDDLACPAASGRRYIGYFNGYYRKGPAIGLDFDSKLKVREFPFPF